MRSLGWRFLPRMLNLVLKAFPLKKWEKPGEEVDECSTFLDMMNHDIGVEQKEQHYIIKKIINIAIRSTFFMLFL